jgi:hypothetical protein
MRLDQKGIGSLNLNVLSVSETITSQMENIIHVYEKATSANSKLLKSIYNA